MAKKFKAKEPKRGLECRAPRKDGRPCRNRAFPCHWHPNMAERETVGPSMGAIVRKQILADGIVAGKAFKDAAKDAGYNNRVQESDFDRDPIVINQIKRRIDDSPLDPREVIGTLVSHMRGDMALIFPENEVIRRAHKNGVSHLIKKIRETVIYRSNGQGIEPDKEVRTEVELYNAQDAANSLANLLVKAEMLKKIQEQEKGLKAAVERIILIAEQNGQAYDRAEIERKLKPHFDAELISNGVN